jgi:ABC-type polysaccharide/polyol phosphate export permease
MTGPLPPATWLAVLFSLPLLAFLSLPLSLCVCVSLGTGGLSECWHA